MIGTRQKALGQGRKMQEDQDIAAGYEGTGDFLLAKRRERQRAEREEISGREDVLYKHALAEVR
jgi:hypothetical protein